MQRSGGARRDNLSSVCEDLAHRFPSMFFVILWGACGGCHCGLEVILRILFGRGEKFGRTLFFIKCCQLSRSFLPLPSCRYDGGVWPDHWSNLVGLLVVNLTTTHCLFPSGLCTHVLGSAHWGVRQLEFAQPGNSSLVMAAW